MSGSRLEFVVVPLDGEVVRYHTRFEGKKKNGATGRGLYKERVSEPAGFMVYFPRGHALRFRDMAELKRYRLNREPKFINLQGLNDPNSPIGKVLAAQDDKARAGAMKDLQQFVIDLATAKTGKELLTIEETEQEAA